MSSNFQETVNISDQLMVGSDPVSVAACGFGAGPTKLDGAVFAKGPVLIGGKGLFLSPGVPRANLMITKRPSPVGILAEALPLSIIQVENSLVGGAIPSPIDILIGAINPCGVTINAGIGGVNIFSGTTLKRVGIEGENTIAVLRNYVSALIEDIGAKIFLGLKNELGIDINAALAFNLAPQLNKTTNNAIDHVGATSTVNLLQCTKKGFDIPHPSKDGHRLRYICIEGPDAEVYLRGKLKGDNVIQLPDVWRDLVDPDSIGVTLTPIGCYQELFMENVEWGKNIIIKNNLSGPINCSYVVYGTRKDTPRNIPEYEGLTTDDFPGDNSEYVINGRVGE